MTPKEQEIAIGELEEKVDRLRNIYEQYFLGFEKLEPTVPRKDVDRRFAILRKEQIRNTALRFRFNVVTQKFNTYAMHWVRICRQIEEGTYKRHIRKAKARFGDGARADDDREISIDIDMEDFENTDLESVLDEASAAADAFANREVPAPPAPAPSPAAPDRAALARQLLMATPGTSFALAGRREVLDEIEPHTPPPSLRGPGGERIARSAPLPPGSKPRIVRKRDDAEAPGSTRALPGTASQPKLGAPQSSPRMPAPSSPSFNPASTPRMPAPSSPGIHASSSPRMPAESSPRMPAPSSPGMDAPPARPVGPRIVRSATASAPGAPGSTAAAPSTGRLPTATPSAGAQAAGRIPVAAPSGAASGNRMPAAPPAAGSSAGRIPAVAPAPSTGRLPAAAPSNTGATRAPASVAGAPAARPPGPGAAAGAAPGAPAPGATPGQPPPVPGSKPGMAARPPMPPPPASNARPPMPSVPDRDTSPPSADSRPSVRPRPSLPLPSQVAKKKD